MAGKAIRPTDLRTATDFKWWLSASLDPDHEIRSAGILWASSSTAIGSVVEVLQSEPAHSDTSKTKAEEHEHGQRYRSSCRPACLGNDVGYSGGCPRCTFRNVGGWQRSL